MLRVLTASFISEKMRGWLSVPLLCTAFLVLGPSSQAVADCMSACQSSYNSCVYGFNERDCATSRSICQNRCIMSATSFGAIAYSPSTGGYGYATEYRSRARAEHIALGECAAYSDGADCQVLVWFRNHCGALAASDDGAYGSAYAAALDAARHQALDYCQAETDGGDCEILVAVCSK
ncbi:MAG: DUF4189 domain-containing protein [Pseudomonadota bacterium]